MQPCGDRFDLRGSPAGCKLVAGAGFEPAIPRLRDYEPEGLSPVSLKKPLPKRHQSSPPEKRYRRGAMQIQAQASA